MNDKSQSTTIRISLGMILLTIGILFAIGLLGGYAGSRFSTAPITVLPNGDRTIVPVNQQVTISPSKTGETIVATQGKSVLLLVQQTPKGITTVGTGIILTNDGVVMSTKELPETPLFAIGEDGNLSSVTTIGRDILSGITFLKIPDQILPPITLAQSSPKAGAEVMSVFRDERTMHPSSSRHTISAIIAPEEETVAPGITQVAQLTGEHESLPSGTALFNDEGNLVGALRDGKIPTMLLVPDITSALARLSANTLSDNPFESTGLTITWKLQQDAAGIFAMRAIISHVTPKTPAFDAGLKAEDILTSINGNAITWDSTVSDALAKHPLTLSLVREASERTITLP